MSKLKKLQLQLNKQLMEKTIKINPNLLKDRPNFQSNIKIVWGELKGKMRFYKIVAKEDDAIIAINAIIEQETKEKTADYIANDYCEWIRKHNGSKIIEKHFINKDII